jgi:hypothetical protein
MYGIKAFSGRMRREGLIKTDIISCTEKASFSGMTL